MIGGGEERVGMVCAVGRLEDIDFKGVGIENI